MTVAFPNPLQARAYFQLRMLPAIARTWRSKEQAISYFSSKRLLSIDPLELSARMEGGEFLVVLDVRSAEEFAGGHLPGAIHFPKTHWTTFDPFSGRACNVVYCGSHRSPLAAEAAAEFSGRGYAVIEMDGGFEAWRANNLQVEKEKGPP